MATSTLCLQDLVDYTPNPCGDYKLAGAADVALIEFGHEFTDFTSVSQWQAEIAAGRVKIIKDVKADYPEVSANEVDVLSNRSRTQRVSGLNHVLNIQDGNVSDDNDTFYETLNGAKSYVAWYNSETNEIMVEAINPVTWLSKPAKDDTAESFQSYMVQAKWFSKPNSFPVRYTAPAGIFD